MTLISLSPNWKSHANGKRSWERVRGGCVVQLCVCVCDWAPVCVWLCAPSWSEVKEIESHKSHTAGRGASLEFESEDYSWTLPVHSLFNPLIDDSSTSLAGRQIPFICLLQLHNFSSGERVMGGHPCLMVQNIVINNNQSTQISGSIQPEESHWI